VLIQLVTMGVQTAMAPMKFVTVAEQYHTVPMKMLKGGWLVPPRPLGTPPKTGGELKKRPRPGRTAG